MSEPQTKKTKVSALDQLKALTTIVADTGDFEGMLNKICGQFLVESSCILIVRYLWLRMCAVH